MPVVNRRVFSGWRVGAANRDLTPLQQPQAQQCCRTLQHRNLSRLIAEHSLQSRTIGSKSGAQKSARALAETLGRVMNLSLIPIFTSVAAGAIVGASLGFIFTARRQAIRGEGQRQENPFRWFFSRPLNDIILFEWFVYFAIVMSGCLVLIALTASPIWVAQRLSLQNGVVLPVSYALGALSLLITYPIGRKLWLRQL